MKLSFECDLRWDDLAGANNLQRHCERCDHDVYNLSGMTRERAQRVLETHEGKKLCVHFVTRDGRIAHDGDPLQQLRAQRNGVRRLVAVALLAQGAFLAFADTPTDHYLDPFAAVAAEAKELVIQPIDKKYEDANETMTMGMVRF